MGPHHFFPGSTQFVRSVLDPLNTIGMGQPSSELTHDFIEFPVRRAQSRSRVYDMLY